MSHPLQPYTTPKSLQSTLLLNAPPDSVPPTDELEAVQAELKALKLISLDRAKKAEGDLKAIEAALKKMREKEKGKAKAVTKIKREQSYTPSLPPDERASTPSVQLSPKASSSSTSVPTLAFSPPLSKASSEIRKIKKKEKDKKRKRDLEESDGELESQRPRKFSPLPPSQKESHQHRPSKLSITSHSHSKATTGPDWSLPPSNPLLQPRPPIPVPPVAGPSKPIEVTEDFSKAKAPSQVPVTTFYTTVEPWLRSIREEDVGWLEYTADEVEPYVIPKLGRHYTEVWEDEEIKLYGGVPAALDFSNQRNHVSHASVNARSLPKWDPSSMADGDLTSDKGHGPVTERLVSALLPAPDMTAWKNIKEAEDAFEAKPLVPGSNGGVGTLGKEKVNVADFEERVRDTARCYGLLDGELDFSQTLDDPISHALRQAQRQLRTVVATNKARKVRLVETARDRLAYQEYVEWRESIDKNISASFSKLQKKDGPKIGKKKKKGDMNGGMKGVKDGNGPVPPLPNPASSGLGPDEEGKLYIPGTLKALVDTRRRWVDLLGSAFDLKQKEHPGRLWGVPKSSTFEGIDEEVAEQLQFRRLSSHIRRDGGESIDGMVEADGVVGNPSD